MSTLSSRTASTDVQASLPTLQVSLSRVGVTGVEKVIRISDDAGVEQYVLCRSSARREKELAMLEPQRERLRAQLDRLHASLDVGRICEVVGGGRFRSRELAREPDVGGGGRRPPPRSWAVSRGWEGISPLSPLGSALLN